MGLELERVVETEDGHVATSSRRGAANPQGVL